MSRFFWDTNLFIYQIEAVPLWESKVNALIAYQERHRISLITSTLTLGEVLVKPTKDQRSDLIQAYEAVFADIESIPIGFEVARTFARLRADYGFNAPDSLQVASAIVGQATLMITNDERLTRLSSGQLKTYSLDGFLAEQGLAV